MSALFFKIPGRRWAMFNAVGIAGLLFQVGCLAVLKHGLGLHYLMATVVAIELTITSPCWRVPPGASVWAKISSGFNVTASSACV